MTAHILKPDGQEVCQISMAGALAAEADGELRRIDKDTFRINPDPHDPLDTPSPSFLARFRARRKLRNLHS